MKLCSATGIRSLKCIKLLGFFKLNRMLVSDHPCWLYTGYVMYGMSIHITTIRGPSGRQFSLQICRLYSSVSSRDHLCQLTIHSHKASPCTYPHPSFTPSALHRSVYQTPSFFQQPLNVRCYPGQPPPPPPHLMALLVTTRQVPTITISGQREELNTVSTECCPISSSDRTGANLTC